MGFVPHLGAPLESKVSLISKVSAVAHGVGAGVSASLFPVLDDRGLGIQRQGPADQPTFVITDVYNGGSLHADHFAGLGRTTVYGVRGALGAAILSVFVPGIRELDTSTAATYGALLGAGAVVVENVIRGVCLALAAEKDLPSAKEELIAFTMGAEYVKPSHLEDLLHAAAAEERRTGRPQKVDLSS